MTADHEWPAQWLRGVLELCVLALVCERETYGYAIAQSLQEAGLGRIKGGTLYPILLRLEEDGLVSSAWREGDAGPGRKFFRATDEGRRELRRRADRWSAFTATTNALVSHVLEESP
jgi:PadR family transcriptional regulator, regulatory protein PadR